MKKFAVIFLSVVMVLALATVAFGDTKVNGELRYRYYFEGAASENGATALGQDSNDVMDGKIKITATPSDKLTIFGAIKASLKDNNDVTLDTTATPSATAKASAGNRFFWDEYYAKYNAGFGTFTIGDTDFDMNGPYVDLLDGAFKNLRGASAVAFSTKVLDMFDVAAYYNPDYYGGDEALYDNAYALRVGFNKEKYGVEGIACNVNKPEDLDPALDSAQAGRCVGYMLNAYYIPMENLALYTSIGRDQKKDVNEIVGVNYKMLDNKLTCEAEYDLDKDNGHDDSGADKFKDNLWGVKFIYAATSNITYEFAKVQTGTKDSAANQTSTCYLTAKFSF